MNQPKNPKKQNDLFASLLKDPMTKRNKKKEIICRCNNIFREDVETAIKEGCDTLNKIFDATTAGVGSCGGTCRRKLAPLLEHYLATGTFPEKIIEDLSDKPGFLPVDKKK